MTYGENDQSQSQQDPEFERQDLVDMVHEMRGVIPGAEPEVNTPRRPTRITHHEIKAMKVTVRKESSPINVLVRMIGGIFTSISGVIGSILSSGMTNNQCKIYGHVFPKHWQGTFPRCTQCRKVLKNPDQLKPK